MSSKTNIQFGIITDCQYDGLNGEPNSTGTRFCISALGKLQDPVDELNRHELDFVINFGDLIDKQFENSEVPPKGTFRLAQGETKVLLSE